MAMDRKEKIEARLKRKKRIQEEDRGNGRETEAVRLQEPEEHVCPDRR